MAKKDSEIIEFEGKKINIVNGLICPACQGELRISYTIQEIPHFGKTQFIGYSCKSCNYKNTDLIPLEDKKPIKQKLVVKSLKDLYIKLVRGSDTIIELKEIGISLEPGVNPNSFYTNIEGLLSRFNMSVNSMIRYYGILKSEEKDKSELVKINDALNRLDVLKQKMHNYIEGLEQFTIILDAKKGHGAILSSKAEDITKKTIKKKEPKNKKLVPKKKKTIKRNKK